MAEPLMLVSVPSPAAAPSMSIKDMESKKKLGWAGPPNSCRHHQFLHRVF